MRTRIAACLLALLTSTWFVHGQTVTLPAGYWSEAQSQELLSRAEVIRLAPDLSTLSADERMSVRELVQAGTIIQSL